MLYFNAPGQEKAHPMKELTKGLFTTENQDNKNTTLILGELAIIIAEAWIGEMVDLDWINWNLLSQSGGSYSWGGLSDELEESLIGAMATNCL